MRDYTCRGGRAAVSSFALCCCWCASSRVRRVVAHHCACATPLQHNTAPEATRSRAVQSEEQSSRRAELQPAAAPSPRLHCCPPAIVSCRAFASSVAVCIAVCCRLYSSACDCSAFRSAPRPPRFGSADDSGEGKKERKKEEQRTQARWQWQREQHSTAQLTPYVAVVVASAHSPFRSFCSAVRRDEQSAHFRPCGAAAAAAAAAEMLIAMSDE